MPKFEPRENSGFLFKNRDKKSGDPETEKYPDYRGDANIAGSAYWISAWIREAKNGSKFLSVAFKSKIERRQQSQKSLAEGMDDSIPF